MTTTSAAPQDTPDAKKLALDAWIKVVGTQEHFNEICMKVRTLYATVVAALLSIYGVFIKERVVSGTTPDILVDPVLPLAFAAALMTYLFYFVDRYWYHALLRGAVDQGKDIEDRWATLIPEIAMGAKITAHSAIDVSDKKILKFMAWLVVSDPRLKSENKLHSDAKIEIFYKPIGYGMFVVTLFSLFAGGLKIYDTSLIGWLCKGVARVVAGS